MEVFHFAKYAIRAILLILVLASCNSTKYLRDDEYLLKGNAIAFNKKEKIPNKRNLKAELATFFKQKENRKFFFFFPREWFYFATQDPGDTTAIDRFQRRVIAEKPAIYSEQISRETARDMLQYLREKGFFQAEEVYVSPKIKGKKVFVTYYVTPHQQYSIDSVFFSSRDTNIHQIVQGIQNQTLFKRGLGLDIGLYEAEKSRITDYLRNHGYAFFYNNSFGDLEIDTFQTTGKGNLYVEILPPFEDSVHQAYHIGEVKIYPSFDPTDTLRIVRLDTLIGGFRFVHNLPRFRVKPQTIINAIYLRSGDLYSDENIEKTNNQLSALGIYRFWRVKQEVDTLVPNRINFRIELTPNYRMELGADIELNYTNRSGTSGTGNLIGVAVHPSFRNRNLFGGAEALLTNFSAGAEMNFQENRFWNTVDLRIQTDLYFPKFQDYFKIWKGLNSIPFGKQKRVLSTNSYALLKEKAVTRVSASYNYILILDWYQYNLFNASYGYDLQKSPTQRFFINHVGIDLLIPKTQPEFERLLDTNDFLENSFGQQLFVSLLFRDLNFVYNGRPNRYGESKYFSLGIEMAGAEIWAANAIYNEFSLHPRTWRLGKSVDFSQYLKVEGDFRYYKQYSPKTSLAYRVNLGVARPFGFTSDVPYVKQFYVGGPNSIRAWAPRGLGPGGFQDTLALNPRNNLRLYQTGDLKFEFNLEYRFEIFWRLKGAVFLDGGNIWTIRRDPERCGSMFLLTKRTFGDGENACVNYPFYRQIALGSGFGLRFDFSYFIFRFDMGVKLRNNYPRDHEGRVRESDYWETYKGFGLRDISFNFGLGYPF